MGNYLPKGLVVSTWKYFKYIIEISIYEGRLFVCLVLYLWDPLNRDSDGVLGLFQKLKSSWWGRVHGLGAMAFGLGVVQKFWNVEWFLHWKLNQIVAENSNKFQKVRFWKEKSVEDMVPLGPLHRPH